jgi:predicted transcriptional regulator
LGLRDDDVDGNAKRVLEFIQEHPGCHLRQVRKELEISMGTAQYHLDQLEKASRITSTRRGLRKHYFPAGLFQDNEKSLLQVLGQETARDILMFIIEQRHPTQTDIAEKIGVSTASINWHVGRLLELGLITEVRDGKFKRYQLSGDPRYLMSLMKNYYPSIWDRWSNRLAEMFLSMSGGDEQ